MSISSLPDPSRLMVFHDGPGALGVYLRLDRKATNSELLTGQGIPTSLGGFVGNPGRLGDVIHSFRASVYLVSPRLQATLLEIKATGWTATPIDIEGLDSAVGYALLGVTGRCGPTTGARDIPSPGLHPYGRWLDMTTWDGSDVFLTDNYNCILLTPRCAAALKKARLVNVRLDPSGLEAVPEGD